MMKQLLQSALILALALPAVAAPIDVYFGTGGREAKGIYRAKFDTEKGKLSKIELAAEVSSPGFLAKHPTLKVLYAAAGGGDVVAYTMAADGGLTMLSKGAGGDGGSAHIAVHPSGRLLLTAQYGGGSVAVFQLTADGKVGDRVQLIEHEGGSGVVKGRQNSPHPHWCGFSPNGKHAFVPDLGLDGIVTYEVTQENGVPVELKKSGIAMSVPGGGPRHMKFSIDGKFVYLLNELTLSVTTFAYDADSGKLTKQGTVPALSEEVKAKETFNSASEILVHSNGKFVYSANRGHDSVTVYNADPATGVLEVLEVEPIRGAWPRNINLDPTGKWLLAAGQNSNTISVFSIDQDNGELSFPRGSVSNVPGCICILFDE